jgi:hypothetical protein
MDFSLPNLGPPAWTAPHNWAKGEDAVKSTPPSKETPATAPAAASTDTDSSPLTFDDLIDTLNPLQHIPVLNTLYRALTGDKISDVARVAGGALYGGVIGLVTAVASAVVHQTTGRDPGDHVLVALLGEDAVPSDFPTSIQAPTQLAESYQPTESSPATGLPPGPTATPASSGDWGFHRAGDMPESSAAGDTLKIRITPAQILETLDKYEKSKGLSARPAPAVFAPAEVF